MHSYNVIITAKAQSDISECIAFVMKVSNEAALSLFDDIYANIESLKLFPERNPVFEMPKSFPIVIRKHIISKKYIALYGIEKDSVIIYRLIDSRRNFDYLI